MQHILNTLQVGLIHAQFGNGFQPASDSPYTPQEITNDNVLGILVTFLSNLIGIITIIGGLFFIVYSFLGAFSWITAGGESGKIEKARQRIFHGVLGLIVIVMSYALIGIVGTIVGLDLINLEETINQVVPREASEGEPEADD